MQYDLAVVGAGIVGLAHALAAARKGLSVVVIDRDAQANGASIRNFGLVVVTGQEEGRARSHAERSRDIWLELAAEAGIEVLQRGKVVAAQRPEAMALLETFSAGSSGVECRLLTPAETADMIKGIDPAAIVGGIFSPHELRVESRVAIPKLAAFLEQRYGVAFRRGHAVTAVAPPHVETSGGSISAAKVVVCPGDDLGALFPERIAQRQVTRCKLQMVRLASPGHRLPSALISDLSLLRYGGYSALPEAGPLRAKLSEERGAELANGVHLIVTQSADGSLVVGDSHHYGHTPDPFGSQDVDALMLREFEVLFGRAPEVTERWIGTYASAPDHAYFADAPMPDVRLVIVTSGTGASTGFAIGEETVADLFNL